MKLKNFILALLITFICLIFSNTAYSQTAPVNSFLPNYYTLVQLHPPVWEKMPIKVFISDSAYKTDVQQAFTAWSEISADKIYFDFINDVKSSDIEVYFVNNLPFSDNDKYIAGSSNLLILKNKIIKAKIYIRNTDPKTHLNLENDKIKTAALHEIGHALGISMHSDNSEDIMFPSVAEVNKNFSPRDINTLNSIYSDFEPSNHILKKIHKKRLKEAKDAIKMFPENSDLYIFLGNTYRNNKNYFKAEKAYDKAFKIDPSNNRALYAKALLYYQTKKYDKSLQLLDVLIEKDADYLMYIYAYTKISKKRGYTDKAKIYFEKYLRQHPDENNKLIDEIKNMLL